MNLKTLPAEQSMLRNSNQIPVLEIQKQNINNFMNRDRFEKLQN